MEHLRLFENPDNISWYDSKFYYQEYNVYPIPFSICFKEESTWRNVKGQDKKVWKEEDYVGVIIGPMVGGHSANVFTSANEIEYTQSCICKYTHFFVINESRLIILLEIAGFKNNIETCFRYSIIDLISFLNKPLNSSIDLASSAIRGTFIEMFCISPILTERIQPFHSESNLAFIPQ